MKSRVKVLAVLFVLATASFVFPKQVNAQQMNVSFQVFYDQLSPYGQWINNPNYGYVWLPDAGSDFTPYSSSGHWVLTDYGWTWVSDYSWGWAPFHYGRWDYDNFYGWMWIPDNEWGPSWVTWRRANGYYGWEPMGPGITVSLSFGRPYNSHSDHWMFVRDRDFERSDLNHYYIDRSEHITIINNSTVINKTYVDSKRRTTYVSGPAREDVQKVTGRKINPVVIQENNKPGQALANGQLRIYRPMVSKNNVNDKKPIPSRVVNIKDVKKISERNSKSQTQTVNPSNNNTQQRQPISVKPSKNYDNKTQTSKAPTNKPVNNTKQVRQQNTVAPSNINTVQTQPNKQQNVNPVNTKQVRQQNTVVPSNNNTVTTQPNKQQNVAPVNNANQMRQQNTVTPSNNIVKSQPTRQQNVAPSNKPGQMRQTNNEKPANDTRREQPRETRSENDKK
jgi:hypothetical protein